MWNVSYQALYYKTKSLIKADVCMKFYSESKLLYLKTDASRIGLGAALLQTRDGTTCPKDIASDNTILRPTVFRSKSLTSAEHWYSNIEREEFDILHSLKKIHHYCFARKVNIIMDHKALVAISKTDVVTLSQWIQHIFLRIHQYRVRLLYKLGLEIFISDWLSDRITRKTKMKQYMG